MLKTYLDSFEQKEVGPSLVKTLEENGYTPYQYQLDAVKQALAIIENNNGVIIADVVGLDKTIIACAVVRELKRRGVVICPPGLVGDRNKNSGWMKYTEEFRLYDWEVRSLGDLENIADFVNRAKDIEVVIVDEAHRFRNQDTQDYEYLKNICRNKIVILLTATPFNNRPGDILSLLKLFITPKKSSITLENNLVGKFTEFKGVFDRLGYIKKYWNSPNEAKRKKAENYYAALFGKLPIDLVKIKKKARKSLKTVSLMQAFSVEPVTKQFYGELQYWYFWAMDKIKFPDDYKYSNDPAKDKEVRNATNLIRLITRIIFIRFLTEKGLIPPELFSRENLEKVVKDFMKDKKASNFYNAVLQNLFFGTLNQKMDERKFAQESGFQTHKKEYGVKNLFRYADKFLISKDNVLELFKNIPFLNGGLFDCLDKEDETGKIIYVDGFSRNQAKQSIIPDYLFFQQEEERVDLSSYGLGASRPVRGLIEILNSYNFTIDENTPIDQEIALDPELLGKVFENLLASYNPETATTARKATGSYYTPREIVDYMVEESLIAYLSTASIPAGGFGIKDIPDALNKNQREERLKEINEAFDEGINYPDYARKLYLIENCIYGVDI